MALAHRLHGKADFLRAPKRRCSIDENTFFVFVEKPLVPLVPEGRIDAILERKKGAAHVRKNETKLRKPIHGSAQHQTGDVDGCVHGPAQIPREIEFLHAVGMGERQLGGGMDKDGNIKIADGLVKRMELLAVHENAVDVGIHRHPFES